MHSDDKPADQRRHRVAAMVSGVAGEKQRQERRADPQVDADEAGQRLDNFLARHLADLPKSHLFRIIRSGEVRVNGARARPEHRLAGGDRLRLPPSALAKWAVPAQAGASGAGAESEPGTAGRSPLIRGQAQQMTRQLAVIHEDEAVLVVDKPYGMAVHGGSGVNLGVIEAMRMARPELRFLELAHRLDRETSGLLVLAKKRTALVALQAQFRERQTRKQYQALVWGRLPRRDKTIRLALSRDEETASGDRRVRIDPAGQVAISIVKGLAHAPGPLADAPLSRAGVVIETGRTHQIRVHLAAIGHPILGDPKYGDFSRNRQLQSAGHRRMYLHAWRLSFRHPVSAAMMTLEAPLPPEFLELVPDQARAGDDRQAGSDGVEARQAAAASPAPVPSPAPAAPRASALVPGDSP